MSPASPSSWGPGLSVGVSAGVPVVTLAGTVDRELAGRADPLLQVTTFSHDGPIAIDVSAVDAVNGALLGLLLRAVRRLAMRDRGLIVVCGAHDTRRKLELAGFDELALVVATVAHARPDLRVDYAPRSSMLPDTVA